MNRTALFVLVLLPVPAAAQDMSLSQILLPGEGWRLVAGGLPGTRGVVGDGAGNVYLLGSKGRPLLRIGADGRSAVDPPWKRRAVTGGAGKEMPLPEGSAVADAVVTRAGRCYCTVPAEQAVYLVEADGKKRKVDEGITAPRGAALWPDGGTLVVGDAAGKHLYAYRVEPDGSLSAKERYYTLWVRPREPSDVAGLAVDGAGRLYAATREGVQVFDPTGRLSGILLSPGRGPVTGVAFGGADLDRLYVVCDGALYLRKVQAKGVRAEGATPKPR